MLPPDCACDGVVVVASAVAAITAIRTQGRQDYNQWVTSYKVYFGNDGVRFIPYKKGGRVKVSVYRRKAMVTGIFYFGDQLFTALQVSNQKILFGGALFGVV